MEAEAGRVTDEQGAGDALAEYTRLSQAQRDAAHAGRFEEVGSLLGARRLPLERLRDRGVRPEEIDAARALDVETRRALETEIRRIAEALSRLATGSRALSGYAGRAATLPAFVDHVR